MSYTLDASHRRSEPAGTPGRRGGQVGEPALPLAHVVLVDVRPERRAVMRTLLEGSGMLSVVGEADSALGAVEEVGRTVAEVAIVEIQPVDDGLATVATLRQHFPQLRIVVCSFHQGAATKRSATDNGADAYLAKPVDYPSLRALLQQFVASKAEPEAVTAGEAAAGA